MDQSDPEEIFMKLSEIKEHGGELMMISNQEQNRYSPVEKFTTEVKSWIAELWSKADKLVIYLILIVLILLFGYCFIKAFAHACMQRLLSGTEKSTTPRREIVVKCVGENLEFLPKSEGEIIRETSSKDIPGNINANLNRLHASRNSVIGRLRDRLRQINQDGIDIV